MLRAKVEKAEGNKKLNELTETQNGSNLQVCSEDVYEKSISHGLLTVHISTASTTLYNHLFG